jgi:hypothetical protein
VGELTLINMYDEWGFFGERRVLGTEYSFNHLECLYKETIPHISCILKIICKLSIFVWLTLAVVDNLFKAIETMSVAIELGVHWHIFF